MINQQNTEGVMVDPMLDVALKYNKIGIPVFPCRAGEEDAFDPKTGELFTLGAKAPLTSNGFHAARRVRQSSGAYAIPAKKHLAASARNDGDPIVGRTQSLHIKLNENTLADYIDSKPRLARIRSALGPLLDPFEDAVLGGRTMGMIGTEAGFTGKAAETAGKALVLSAIAVVDGFLGQRKYVPANDNYLRSRRKIA